MSESELHIAASSIVLIVFTLAAVGLLIRRDLREIRENDEWRKRRDAEAKRRQSLDKTIWGAQVPPAAPSNPTR
jgi:hypothetical protein